LLAQAAGAPAIATVGIRQWSIDADAAVLLLEATAALVELDFVDAALAEFLFFSHALAALNVHPVATAATTSVDSSRCVTKHLPGEIGFPA